MSDFSEIVVPVDGSEGALQAARFGLRLARSMNLPIRLLYVFPVSTMDSAWLVAVSEDELRKARDEAGRALLSTVREKLGVDEQTAPGVLLSGDPAGEILAYLEEDPTRTAVMGRRGLSGIGGLVLGSVSDKVVRHARRPVTLVN